MTLHTRLRWAKANIPPAICQYCIVWEDPTDLESQVKIVYPDPNWMAAALHGGILPPVEVYSRLKCEWVNSQGDTMLTWHKHNPGKDWRGGKVLNGYLLHDTPAIEALTEEEAMEYLVVKEVPPSVWSVEHNRPMFCITKAAMLPKNRTWRDAWRLAA